MAAKYKAVIIGGLGVIGRAIIAEFENDADWELVALSRRAPDFPTQCTFISVDLLDRAATETALRDLRDVTHIFFCALSGGIAAENVADNLALLVNPVDVISANNPGLQRVVLAQGGKVYGRHLGPFKVPAQEDDPRHLGPNFYYDQEDYLRDKAARSGWTWAALRPEAVIGFAIGNPMNMAMFWGVYAAISKQRGLELRYPGTEASYSVLWQVTDAGLLARAFAWAATAEAAANQAYNITNGDAFRFRDLWPMFAECFGMTPGPRQKVDLTVAMAGLDDEWQRVVEQHGLQPYAYADIVQWPYAEWNMNSDWDVLLSDNKRLVHGFTELVDTPSMWRRAFAQLQDMSVLPKP